MELCIFGIQSHTTVLLSGVFMSSELMKDGAGMINPEFPHLGPQQPMPTTATPMDDMLLQVLIFAHTLPFLYQISLFVTKAKGLELRPATVCICPDPSGCHVLFLSGIRNCT